MVAGADAGSAPHRPMRKSRKKSLFLIANLQFLPTATTFTTTTAAAIIYPESHEIESKNRWK